MKPVLSRELVEREIATPEQIDAARKYGKPFQFEDSAEKLIVTGFNLNDVTYITDIIDVKTVK